jgi:glutamate racemase
MATHSTIYSTELDYQIRSQIPQSIRVTKINSSSLIKLIEDGVHLSDEKATIESILEVVDDPEDMDVITLSSTHLPIIKNYFLKLFPNVGFVDPAKNIVKDTKIFLKNHRNLRMKGISKIQILITRNKEGFQKILRQMGYTEKVTIVRI